MKGYIQNIEEQTLENDAFRKVLYTTNELQLVLMTLQPGEEIGAEVHDDATQFIRVEAGHGMAILNDTETPIEDGSAVVIPGGTKHNIINISESEPLRLYTLYSPPEHKKDTFHKTKEDADEDHDHHYDGVSDVA